MINPGLIVAFAALAVAIYAVWCCSHSIKAAERRMERKIDDLSGKVGALLRAVQETHAAANEALEVQRQWREIDGQDKPR